MEYKGRQGKTKGIIRGKAWEKKGNGANANGSRERGGRVKGKGVGRKWFAYNYNIHVP